MRRHGYKISFNNKSKYDGLRGSHALANSFLRRYLNFCEGILSSLVDSFFLVDRGSSFGGQLGFLSLLLFQKRLLHLGKINRHSINAADMTAHPLRTCGNFCGIGWSRWFDALITEAHVKRHNGKYWLVFCSYIIWHSSLQILIHFTPLSS